MERNANISSFHIPEIIIPGCRVLVVLNLPPLLVIRHWRLIIRLLLPRSLLIAFPVIMRIVVRSAGTITSASVWT